MKCMGCAVCAGANTEGRSGAARGAKPGEGSGGFSDPASGNPPAPTSGTGPFEAGAPDLPLRVRRKIERCWK